MKVFIDTCAMISRYINQGKDTEKLENYLDKATEIYVAPTYLIEANHVFGRLKKEEKKNIELHQIYDILYNELVEDFMSFSVVSFSKELQISAIKYTREGIKTLDSIQLASAEISKSKLFLTSDKQLKKFVNSSLYEVVFI